MYGHQLNIPKVSCLSIADVWLVRVLLRYNTFNFVNHSHLLLSTTIHSFLKPWPTYWEPNCFNLKSDFKLKLWMVHGLSRDGMDALWMNEEKVRHMYNNVLLLVILLFLLMPLLLILLHALLVILLIMLIVMISWQIRLLLILLMTLLMQWCWSSADLCQCYLSDMDLIVAVA